MALDPTGGPASLIETHLEVMETKPSCERSDATEGRYFC